MGRRARSNPTFSDLPEDVQVYLDIAMDLGVDFSGLAEVLTTRPDRAIRNSTVIEAERWFWCRGLTWNYEPTLNKQQQGTWIDVWNHLDRWLRHHDPFVRPTGQDTWVSTELSQLFDALWGHSFWDDQVDDEQGNGAAIFYSAHHNLFSAESIRQYDAEIVAELDYHDREALHACVGAILEWRDTRGRGDAALFFTRRVMDDVWHGLEADFSPPEEQFTVVMENTDDDDDMVMLSVSGEGAPQWARNDQSIHGTNWEVSGHNFAYAIVANEPDLSRILREEEGYTVDDGLWSPPDEGDTE